MSGPWMFVSAEMLSIQSVNMDKYGELLSSTQFNVGILGALCTVRFRYSSLLSVESMDSL